MEAMSGEVLVLLFFASLVAGFIDSIAGGGGLISVPILLATGMAPVNALATNKASAMFGSFTATYTYARSGHVKISQMKYGIAFTFIGAAIGTVVVQTLDTRVMMTIIPVLLIGVSLYFAFGPRISNIDRHHLMERTPFYALFGLTIGFYDGFFGPGTGSFWALAFVAVLGFNMLKATAHTKLVNFTSNVTSFLFFAVAGHVLWLPAAVMALGQLLGARIGANTAIKHGAKIIRPLLVTVSLVITAKLIFDNPENIIHQWIAGLIG